MQRQQHIDLWLKTLFPAESFSLTSASADASFRRYFRVAFADRSLIVMDAPPAQEDCRPFIRVQALLKQAGVHVPDILAQDLAQGCLLLSDLGSQTYLQQLAPATMKPLYLDALAALVKVQQADSTALPRYDAALLNREMQLFGEWYVGKHLGVTLSASQQAVLDAAMAALTASAEAQAQVFVHRDYHSRNLMITTPNPGVLDFQDAVHGPITYDLVSLLKDAYIGWEEEAVLDLVVRYWEMARKAGLAVPEDVSDFYRDFELMGAQRQLKVIGIFARLYHRDGKEAYLADIPLVMHYLRKTAERYRVLGPLLKLLNELERIEPQVGYTF